MTPSRTYWVQSVPVSVWLYPPEGLYPEKSLLASACNAFCSDCVKLCELEPKLETAELDTDEPISDGGGGVSLTRAFATLEKNYDFKGFLRPQILFHFFTFFGKLL